MPSRRLWRPGTRAGPAPTARSRPKRQPGRWLDASLHGWTYHVYVPTRLSRGRVPLLVALHGCRQTAAAFAAASRLNALADRHRFVAVYPEQSTWSHRQRCWHWYEPGHQRRGAGEPAAVAAITAAVVAEPTRWRIDPSRVYVAGLSAGGALALILAATYPDVYAAVGIHSAPAYRSATSGHDALAAMAGRTTMPPVVAVAGGAGMPPAVVFQGTADNAVRVRNGQRVVEQWLAYRQAYAEGRDRIGRVRTRTARSSDGRAYRVSAWYTGRGRKVLEYWQVDGLGHAWSGGLPEGSYSDPRGPRAATAMWRFLSAQSLP